MVTKKKFLEYCRTHKKGYWLTVEIYDHYTGACERSVQLHGSWHESTITTRILHYPNPGRQFRNFETTRKRLESSRAKYQKWLDEFNEKEKL